jgi:hypothetical protein
MYVCFCGYTKGPYIRLAVVVFALTYLRGEVVRRADARGSELLSIRHHTAVMFVCYFSTHGYVGT